MTAESLPLTHVTDPPETTVDGRAPAVVVLHGRGADERDLLPIAAQLPEELHVLSVRAPDRLRGVSSSGGRRGSERQERSGGYTWYELDLSGGGLHESQPDQRDFERSLRLVHEFVDAAVDAYDLDPNRVGLLGFSQGAITSLSALAERPEAYDWVVGLNGYLAATHEDDIDAAAGTPAFIGAGRQDQIIPVVRAENAAERLDDADLDVTFNVYPVGHGTTPQEVRDVADWVEKRL
jgi:phospholipase/carboxylesterase